MLGCEQRQRPEGRGGGVPEPGPPCPSLLSFCLTASFHISSLSLVTAGVVFLSRKLANAATWGFFVLLSWFATYHWIWPSVRLIEDEVVFQGGVGILEWGGLCGGWVGGGNGVYFWKDFPSRPLSCEMFFTNDEIQSILE